MEKRNSDKWDSIIEDEEEIHPVEIQVKQQPPASVWLKSQYPDRMIVTGMVTGNRYIFERLGHELLVDARDAPEMLSKVHGLNPCCGRAQARPYFLEIGG